MEKPKHHLKRVIDQFIAQSNKMLHAMKAHPEKVDYADLENFADRIQQLRKLAIDVLEDHPDESTWYNASIIKDLIDEPLALEGNRHHKTSLAQAADITKRQRNDHTLRLLLNTWMQERAMKEVLFEDLRQISMELAA